MFLAPALRAQDGPFTIENSRVAGKDKDTSRILNGNVRDKGECANRLRSHSGHGE